VAEYRSRPVGGASDELQLEMPPTLQLVMALSDPMLPTEEAALPGPAYVEPIIRAPLASMMGNGVISSLTLSVDSTLRAVQHLYDVRYAVLVCLCGRDLYIVRLFLFSKCWETWLARVL
jgi:hypothetical protein